MEGRAHGVMFHHFNSDGGANALGAIGPKQLDRIIRHYGPSNILPAEEWFGLASSGETRGGEVCITFDDALRSQVEFALPVLRKYGLTAFWFIYSSVFEGKGSPFEIYRHFYNAYFNTFDDFFAEFLGHIEHAESAELVAAARSDFAATEYLKQFSFYSDSEREYRYFRDRVLGRDKFGALMDALIGRYGLTQKSLSSNLWMTNEDLLDLTRDGHIIGLHSYTHPTDLKSLDPPDQHQEYHQNATHIRSVVGRWPRTVAHPVNSYDPSTLSLLADLGVEVGFRSNTHLTAHGQLEYPREDCANL